MDHEAEAIDRLICAGDLSQAQAALDLWVKSHPQELALAAHWKAWIDRKLGRDDAALATLTEIIDRGIDNKVLCLSARADLYFTLGRFDQAINDYRRILASTDEAVIEFFRDYANFRIALVLARRGASEFLNYRDALPADYSSWIDGGFVSTADLSSIFGRASRASKR